MAKREVVMRKGPMPDVGGAPAVTEAANAPVLAVVSAAAAPVPNVEELEKRLARVRRQKAETQRELVDVAEAIAHARGLAKERAIKAAVTDEAGDKKAAVDAQDLLRQAIERETVLKHELDPLAAAEQQLQAELARAENAARAKRRSRVLAALETGKAARRARLLDDLVAEALTTQLTAGAPPSDAGRIASNALGMQLLSIGAKAQQLFDTLAKETDGHVA